jgi:hypothetical protein
MGCTPGTTPEYLLVPRMHKTQKPIVSQGLYQSYYSPYRLRQLAPTPALVFCRVWTLNVSYLKHQSTTRPHQPVHNAMCQSVKVLAPFFLSLHFNTSTPHKLTYFTLRGHASKAHTSRLLKPILPAYENFFCSFVFVVCRFCTSKQSFGYFFLWFAKVNFFLKFLFVTDTKPKFGWRVFVGPRSVAPIFYNSVVSVIQKKSEES